EDANAVRRRDDLRDGEVEIDVRLKVDLLHRQTVHGLRFHVLDAVDAGADCVLTVGGYALLHFRRAETGVTPDHRDHRYPDFRKNIARHSANGGRTEEENQGRQHIECVWKSQRESNDTHVPPRYSPARRRTCTAFRRGSTAPYMRITRSRRFNRTWAPPNPPAGVRRIGSGGWSNAPSFRVARARRSRREASASRRPRPSPYFAALSFSCSTCCLSDQ